MGLDFDLAAVAGMTGLGASTIGTLAAAMFFRGLVMRIISQVIVTTLLSFVGFIALFHYLGFEIVPPKEIAGVQLPNFGGRDNFSVQSTPSSRSVTVTQAPAGAYTIKSPWSREGEDPVAE